MIQPAKRLEHFSEYIFVQLAKAVREVEEATGKKVLNFGAGSPDVPPSPKYIEKLSEYILEPNAHMYPGYGAIPEFRDAVIQWHKKRFGTEIQNDEVYPLYGEKQGIALLPLTFLNQGDEVLIPDPGYQGFTGPTFLAGARPVYYNLSKDNNYKISLAELREKVTEKTKFIWINFPSNPLGNGTTIEELQEFVNFAKEHNIFIVYDNAYSEITFDGYVAPSILQVDGAKDVAIELHSFSKSFSFAGYRLGWMVGNKDIIAAFAKVASQTDSGISRPIQQMGAYALTNRDEAWHEAMIENYKKRRDIIAQYLTQLGLQLTMPNASLYIWAQIPEGEKDSWTYCMKLLKEKQILFTPGTAFGKNGEGYVRVSICVNVDRIEDYFNEK